MSQKRGMTIDELITFCEEEEQNHKAKAKRADDASGYTRSKDKNVKTAVAIREEVYGDFYKQIADTMRKYQKIEDIHYHQSGEALESSLRAVIEDGNVD